MDQEPIDHLFKCPVQMSFMLETVIEMVRLRMQQLILFNFL